MKANEAPEKIYVCDDVFPTHVDWEGSPINTKRIDNHDIEYTRTDSFIEKAVDWLTKNAENYIWYSDYSECPGDDTCGMNDDFINDFEKYMKGEIKWIEKKQ